MAPCLCCIYRQKRREEKEGRSKTEVTFRPNESIIPAQDVKWFLLKYFVRSLPKKSIILLFVSGYPQLVNEEPAAKQAVSCGDNASIPCGLFLAHTRLYI